MEFRASYEGDDEREFKLTQDPAEAVKNYQGYVAEAREKGGCAELVICLDSEIVEVEKKHPMDESAAVAYSKADQAAFDQSFKSKKRIIHTNDFQLSVLRAGLLALKEQTDSSGRSIFTKERCLTPAQVVESEMLLGIINDMFKDPSDREVIHGWIL